MENRIAPCIWTRYKAEEMVDFYCTVFEGTSTTFKNDLAITFMIGNQKFIFLNNNDFCSINPTFSLYTVLENEDSLNQAWNTLSNGGKVMMPLGKYPWSKGYGWVVDRFGVSWQLTLGDVYEMGQMIVPSMMFANDRFGRAEEAMTFYTSVFNESGIGLISRYQESDKIQGGKINHGRFTLANQKFIAIDSAIMNDITFNEAASLIVFCRNQEEIDHYWERLSKDGSPGKCGWLKDQFGFFWQIIPEKMSVYLSNHKRHQVLECLFAMEKIDISVLEVAFLSE